MGPIAAVGVSPSQLNDRVGAEVWTRWVETEPALRAVAGLDELHTRRGRDADAPLGALVRLAARDGGDDELAGIAVVHQLEGGVNRLIGSLRDLSDDIDAVVVGALWAEIRSFPWRRRTRAYAASLMYDTRAAVIDVVLPGRTRGRPEPVAFVDPQSALYDSVATRSGSWLAGSSTCEQSARELVELLDWALTTKVIDREDARLILELAAAGEEMADHETPRTLRGTSSQAAVLRVAERRGVCGKTVMRHRDRLVVTLRRSAERYLADVA